MRKLTAEQAREVAEFVVNKTGWDCGSCPCFFYVSDAPDAVPCPVRCMNDMWEYAGTCRQVRLVWLENALKEDTNGPVQA